MAFSSGRPLRCSLLSKLAPTESPVLIRGESGTGKELVARTLHRQSQRHSKPFVAINCGAIPEHLIQSELFGHERGAFTGAAQRKIGNIEAANDGVLFLDELPEFQRGALDALRQPLERGEVEVTLEHDRISVRDTGIGMDADTLAQAYDPFYRADVAHPDRKGMGLAIVARLGERFGWPVWIESEPGRGTLAVIRFQADDEAGAGAVNAA